MRPRKDVANRNFLIFLSSFSSILFIRFPLRNITNLDESMVGSEEMKYTLSYLIGCHSFCLAELLVPTHWYNS